MKFNRRKMLKYGFWSIVLWVLLDAFWLEQFFVKKKVFYLKNTSSENDNIKIVQISDLHLQKLGYAAKGLTEYVHSITPDVICITGDAIDKGHKLSELENFIKLLPLDVPKVAILGNWEYWGQVDLEALKELYTKYNCTLLKNESISIEAKGKRIAFSGVDEYLEKKSDYLIAERQCKENDYHIVLCHCPEYVDTIRKIHQRPIDFVLSGHTHGGQINLLGYAPKLPPGSGGYVSGWYHEDSSCPMFVSKGVGTSIYPIRFGAWSEIAVFNLPA